MAGLGTSQQDPVTATDIEEAIAIACMSLPQAVAIGGIVWAKRQQCRNRRCER
jgi:hypothetical protein